MIERVILVDHQDNVLGAEEKIAAHQKGLCHRAFSIFVFDNHHPKRLLLQQRQTEKYHSGGLWSNTCCGHPRPGEAVLAAATRRLEEELGFVVALMPVGRFHYREVLDQGLIEDEVDYLFVGTYQGETIQPNPEEVMNIAWVAVDSLRNALIHNQSAYSAWFAEAFEKVMARLSYTQRR